MLPVQVRPVAVKSCQDSTSQQVLHKQAQAVPKSRTSFKDSTFHLKCEAEIIKVALRLKQKSKTESIFSCGLVGLLDAALCLMTN